MILFCGALVFRRRGVQPSQGVSVVAWTLARRLLPPSTHVKKIDETLYQPLPPPPSPASSMLQAVGQTGQTTTTMQNICNDRQPGKWGGNGVRVAWHKGLPRYIFYFLEVVEASQVGGVGWDTRRELQENGGVQGSRWYPFRRVRRARARAFYLVVQ